MDVKVTPEWVRSLIPATTFTRDKKNYEIIAAELERLLSLVNPSSGS